MGRPPALPIDEKVRIVLAVISGRSTVSRAARDCGVSQTAICNWRRQFLEAGQAGLLDGLSPQRLARAAELQAENEALRTALREAAVQVRVWKMSAESRLGPSRTSR